MILDSVTLTLASSYALIAKLALMSVFISCFKYAFGKRHKRAG